MEMPRFLRLLLALGLLPTLPLRAQTPPPSGAAAVFPDLKIYDAQGRPWRAAREDWDGARKRVASDPDWAEWLKDERAEVDAWMAHNRDRVEWAAGWSHDFVSPKDATKLVWTDKIPGEQTDHFFSPSDPRVAITPKLFAAWVRTFRERHGTMMERAARLYRLTGDKHYAEWAAGQMDFYTDNYLKWKPARGGARLFWQTLTEASNLVTYAHVVRYLGDYAAPTRREHWRKDFFLPEVAVLNGTYQNVHNIACAQRCAVAEVALVFGDEAMWQDAVDGPYGIRSQVTGGITDDWLWVEQSFGYAGSVVRTFATFFAEAGIYGRADQFDSEMCKVENLMLAPTYYRFPDGHVPNPADSGGIGVAPNRMLFAGVYRVFPTTLSLTLVAGRKNWDTLLDPPPPSPRPVALPPVTSHNLETSRMAILQSGHWQVFFHYGQITRSHTEAEALNFTAYYDGTDITHDPGTVGYGSPMHLGYFTRGLCANVPLVNGEGEDLGQIGERREWVIEQIDPYWPMRGQLDAYSIVPPVRVSAEQPQYRHDASARRTLVIDGNKLTDTATIESKAGGPQKLGLALHLQGKVRLPATFRPDPDFARGRPEPFSYWRDAQVATFHDRAEFDVDYGKLVLHVTLAVPGEFRLWHADTPDVVPARRESFYLETTGTSATFTSTFAPAAKP
ncbi:MAG TPA: heparinase II/III family protein [Opitutaceae bacterium]|nr:heparinase II/III family protein [Opitutaceae bacterium]